MLTADAYVVALGSYSPVLLRPLGIVVPVYPIKGYSITVPITDAGGAPESTVMDETYKVAITRLGDRIRVGGTAEISGYDLRLHAARRATLEHSVGDLFPDGGDLSRASFWCGLRPMTPDGPPIIGAHPAFQPLSQHRPRHARLDHGVRLGPGAGRHHFGTQAGDRRRRTRDFAIRLRRVTIRLCAPRQPASDDTRVFGAELMA